MHVKITISPVVLFELLRVPFHVRIPWYFLHVLAVRQIGCQSHSDTSITGIGQKSDLVLRKMGFSPIPRDYINLTIRRALEGSSSNE